MATNACFPPFEYYVGDQIIGIDVEIARTIADKMGLKLHISDMSNDEILQSIIKGKNDIAMSTFTITDERKKVVDFSDPYAYGIQAIIVREDSGINSADDISKAGKIGVQKDSTGEELVIRDFGEEKLASYNKISTALLDLNSGKIDTIIVDRDVSLKYANGNVGLKVLDTDYAVEDYGIIIRKGNTELRDEINAILKEMRDSGELDDILRKYLEH